MVYFGVLKLGGVMVLVLVVIYVDFGIVCIVLWESGVGVVVL